MVKFDNEDRIDWEMDSTYQLLNLNWFANSTQSITNIHFTNPAPAPLKL